LSRLTISGATPAGPESENQIGSGQLRIAHLREGWHFGNSGTRFAELTASARALPALICVAAVVSVVEVTGT